MPGHGHDLVGALVGAGLQRPTARGRPRPSAGDTGGASPERQGFDRCARGRSGADHSAFFGGRASLSPSLRVDSLSAAKPLSGAPDAGLAIHLRALGVRRPAHRQAAFLHISRPMDQRASVSALVPCLVERPRRLCRASDAHEGYPRTSARFRLSCKSGADARPGWGSVRPHS